MVDKVIVFICCCFFLVLCYLNYANCMGSLTPFLVIRTFLSCILEFCRRYKNYSNYKYDGLTHLASAKTFSTSATACCKTLSWNLGLLISFSTLAITSLANCSCSNCSTLASYLTQESKADLASAAKPTFCFNSKALASNSTVSLERSNKALVVPTTSFNWETESIRL